MRSGLLVAVVVAAAGVGLWLARDSAPVRSATQAIGLPGGDATPSNGATLAAAGVHKCRTANGVAYLDHPCPKGSTEIAANGGTVTVMSFPKPAPAPSLLASGPLIKGMSAEERDRLRDEQIEAAANRR